MIPATVIFLFFVRIEWRVVTDTFSEVWVRYRYRCRYGLTVFYWFVANSTGELIPIPVIRKLVMGGSEKARLVLARVDGALAKWWRHYGEPKGLSGKSSSPLLFPTTCTLLNVIDRKDKVVRMQQAPNSSSVKPWQDVSNNCPSP